MTEVTLSPRLFVLASFVQEGDVVTDVGADHGYLSLYLACRFHRKVYATELSKGPYYKLEDNVLSHGGEGLVECYLADGLDKLRSDSNAVILAGMGGKTIAQILARSPKAVGRLHKVVAEPQSEAFRVRDALMALGFAIEDEVYVSERGKSYPALVATKGEEKEPYDPCELTFGRIPLRKKDPLLLSFLQREKAVLSKLSDEGMLNPKSRAQLSLVEEALKRFQEPQNFK